MIILLGTLTFVELWGTDSGPLTAPQMMARAIITFLLALFILRIAGTRSFGSKSAFDVVLSITVGAVLSNCITGNYPFVACAAAATTLALMHRLFAIISFKSSFLSQLINGQPHVLLKGDKIHWKNMSRHHISLADLIKTLHQKGFSDLKEIEEARIETDGKISMIPKINHHPD